MSSMLVIHGLHCGHPLGTVSADVTLVLAVPQHVGFAACGVADAVGYHRDVLLGLGFAENQLDRLVDFVLLHGHGDGGSLRFL